MQKNATDFSWYVIIIIISFYNFIFISLIICELKAAEKWGHKALKRSKVTGIKYDKYQVKIEWEK